MLIFTAIAIFLTFRMIWVNYSISRLENDLYFYKKNLIETGHFEEAKALPKISEMYLPDHIMFVRFWIWNIERFRK